MQLKISKTLEGIIARTAFQATSQGVNRSYKDFLALELLREEGSLAYQLLSARLKDWELFQVRLRIEREARQSRSLEPLTPAGFYRDFTEHLLATAPAVRSVSTAHALLDIVADRTTATARVLEMYHIDTATILEELHRFTVGDDLRTEVQIRLPGSADPAAPETASGTASGTASETAGAAGSAGTETRGRDNVRKAAADRELDKFGTDLTRLAREGGIDPVVGREAEIERVVQILSRRKKNNPMLIGEAGVGKSAIVEGLALRMARGEVPHTIAGKRLFALDIAALIAGTKFRGDFEERMQLLLDELRRDADTILFIDEIHTIVGAGATQGSLDTANLLKPALARGELQTIGATTFDEYRENIECDAALERRFQRVVVEPATPEQTLRILRGIAPHYERHHRVRYTDEALQACVTLAARYLPERNFPDKAIDTLDEAGARIRLLAARKAAPATTATTDKTAKTSETIRPSGFSGKIGAGEAMTATAKTAIATTSAALAASTPTTMSGTAASDDVATTVSAEVIAEVITSMTGIPVERVADDEKNRLRGLDEYLAHRVIGQREAVRKIAGTIRRSRAGLRDERRPIGVFLFVGPTGVGKTLLARELSKRLFDQRQGLIRIDMSEYAEKHNVARLIGAPPGYVGYGEGGQLTEAVRRQPYAVVLFDEIEKAHPEVFHLLLPLFDEGRLTDGNGRIVDFRNTILIMTSNVGSQAAVQRSVRMGYATTSKESAAHDAPQSEYRKALERTFAPEFLNRIDEVIFFRTLTPADVARIVDLELQELLRRSARLGYTVKVTPGAKRLLADLGYEARYGARALRRTLTDRVEEPLSELIVEGRVKEGDTVVVESDRRHGIRLRVA